MLGRFLFISIIQIICLFISSSVSAGTENKNSIKVILFDVFGTVVDWRSSIIEETKSQFKEKEINIDYEQFTMEWVESYSKNISDVKNKILPFLSVDEIHFNTLKQQLSEYHILDHFSDHEIKKFSQVWQRLRPWADSVPGLLKLKSDFTIGTLSNGNVSLLLNLAKYSNLPWDVILSGEMFKCYKPDLFVYLEAARVLRLDPSEVLLVASHRYDLLAAQSVGYKTAFISRPFEYGSESDAETAVEGEFDFVLTSIEALYNQISSLK